MFHIIWGYIIGPGIGVLLMGHFIFFATFSSNIYHKYLQSDVRRWLLVPPLLGHQGQSLPQVRHRRWGWLRKNLLRQHLPVRRVRRRRHMQNTHLSVNEGPAHQKQEILPAQVQCYHLTIYLLPHCFWSIGLEVDSGQVLFHRKILIGHLRLKLSDRTREWSSSGRELLLPFWGNW